jgi:hypothetical protein
MCLNQEENKKCGQARTFGRKMCGRRNKTTPEVTRRNI